MRVEYWTIQGDYSDKGILYQAECRFTNHATLEAAQREVDEWKPRGAHLKIVKVTLEEL